MDRVEELIATLVNPDVEVRKKAVEELGEIKDARAVEPLLPLLYDPFVKVRRSALEALGKIGDAWAVYSMAGTFLGADRDPSYEPLIRFIDSRRNTEEENLFISMAIQQIGSQALNILIDIAENQGDAISYDSAFSRIRWKVAVLTLWAMPDKRAIEALERLCKNNDSWTKYMYAEFLGEREDQRAIRLLVDLLGDDSWDCWNLAIDSLCNKMGTGTHEVLMRVLNKVSHRVGERAMEVLRLPPA